MKTRNLTAKYMRQKGGAHKTAHDYDRKNKDWKEQADQWWQWEVYRWRDVVVWHRRRIE